MSDIREIVKFSGGLWRRSPASKTRWFCVDCKTTLGHPYHECCPGVGPPVNITEEEIERFMRIKESSDE